MTGLTDTEICRQLGIAMTTVRTHWVRVRRKHGVVNRAQAIATIGQLMLDQQRARLAAREEALLLALRRQGFGLFEIRSDETVALDATSGKLLGVVDVGDLDLDASPLPSLRKIV